MTSYLFGCVHYAIIHACSVYFLQNIFFFTEANVWLIWRDYLGFGNANDTKGLSFLPEVGEVEFLSTQELENHKYMMHKNLFDCTDCGQNFKTKDELVRHMETHKDEVACSKCLFKCSKDSDLALHIETHNIGSAQSHLVACMECGHNCETNHELAKHMEIHKYEFACSECVFKCASNDDLILHMKSHSDEIVHNHMIVCEECGHNCKTKDELATHMEIHKCIFSCSECVFKCATENELLSHMKTHTVEEAHQHLIACMECGYEFKTNQELAAHMEIHKNKFACPKCVFKCTIEDGLTLHMKTHSVVKVFSCSKCNYKCSRNDNLILHMKTHDNLISSFACSECEYKSTSNDMLQKHLLTHKTNHNIGQKHRPRLDSNKRKSSISSTNVWGKLSLDELARQHFIDSLVNNDGFTAPCRNGKPIKQKDLQKVANNGNNNKQPRKSGVVGTAKGSNLTLDNRKHQAVVFATRYRPNTEVSDVKTVLEKNLRLTTGVAHHVDVERINNTRHDSYASFKITCVCNNTSALMNPDIWPERSFVRWWRTPRKTNGGIIGTSTQ